jgi:5-bromo-4-chloroindolyl phosphate hydrolysis protein
MVKKSVYLFYIILALTLIIFGSLALALFKINIIEGADASIKNADEFSIGMKIDLNNKKGRIVPYPLGS